MAWWGSILVSAALDRFLSTLRRPNANAGWRRSRNTRLRTAAQRYLPVRNQPASPEHFRGVLEEQLLRFGESDPRTLAARVDLANQLQEQGCWREAYEQYDEALSRFRTVVGEDDPNVLTLQFAQAQC